MSGPATELWTCMGVRLTVKEKRAVAWLAANDEELTYAERESYVTGGIYEVSVTREDGSVRRGGPRYTGNRVPSYDDRLKQWQVAELAAEQRLARLARERKDKQDGFTALDETMKPLLDLSANCRTRAERSALIADVLRRLSAGWG